MLRYHIVSFIVLQFARQLFDLEFPSSDAVSASPAMRQPEASTPSMLRLPQRPSDIYTGRSRRSPPDGLTLTSDRRRARDSIPDGTSTATTNGFVSSRPTASDMPPTTPTRSNDASSSEEGEVSEDEPMDVDTRTAPHSATARGSQLEANAVPGDDFSIDERTTWYQGRSPNEPARPGVLDDSSMFDLLAATLSPLSHHALSHHGELR